MENVKNEDYTAKYLKYKKKYQELKKVETQLIKEGKLNTDGSLKQSGGSNKVVRLFKADWCGHCQMFKSTWEELQKKHGGSIKFETIDADTDKAIVQSNNIQGFPTIHINGNEYKGSRDFQTLSQQLNSL